MIEVINIPYSENDRILSIGCGDDPYPGAVNHDKTKHAPHVDIAHDLNITPWPWEDASFEVILALDVVEHLSVDVSVWLDECHRILSSEGTLVVRVPHYTHENAFTDPTHRRFFTPRTFDYWDKSTLLHQKYGKFYFVDASRWWKVTSAHTDMANIMFVLRKEPSP